MRWCILICAFGLFTQAIAGPGPDPDPKKYIPETKEKTTKVTAEEKAFLKEVEAKYGVKSDKPEEEIKEAGEVETKTETKSPESFPAVIAIEIVNDTETESKGKRTIDANLGYGYRTNNGYTYTYFGRPRHEQGKFMIYPYSQEDIPPPRTSHQNFGNYQRPNYHQQTLQQSHSKFSTQYSHSSPSVQIQPSKAYELVPVTEETPSYHYREPVSELKSAYERVKSYETPPPPQYQDSQQRIPSTLYTTYNGGQLSGLTGQFPSVMSNYFVDSSQLLRSPQFQSVGLTSDHLRQHGPGVGQQVVPVLVLRIPSSHLHNPTADLYPNLPSNYPLSNYLNNVNLQDLVAQYFKKAGYPHIPQVMTHYSPALSAPAVNPIQYSAHSMQVPVPVTQYRPATAEPANHYPTQHYAAPEPQPTYTHTDASGVQYSAVQPAMAKYPSPASQITAGQHYMVQNPHTGQQTIYQYVQPSSANYRQYLQDEYQQPQYQSPQYEYQYVDGSAGTQYQTSGAVQEYESSNQPEANQAAGQGNYAPPHDADEQRASAHSTDEDSQTSQQYVHQQPGSDAESEPVYATPQPASQSEDKEILIPENYPSKDHTQAIVSQNYKSSSRQHSGVQSVSYVTPSPLRVRYHPYRIMAPQAVLSGDPGVSYVNSHSMASPAYHHGTSQEDNPEKEETADLTYTPPVGSQKPPNYPRNYHSHSAHQKRMASSKQDGQSRSPITLASESAEKRPSS